MGASSRWRLVVAGFAAVFVAKAAPAEPIYPMSPEQAAAAALARGDARPVMRRNHPMDGLYCFIWPRSDRVGPRGARRIEEAMGSPPRLDYDRTPAREYRLRDEAARSFAEDYNRIVFASPSFPYPDICTNVPEANGIAAQRASFRPPRDDGSAVSAIRLGRIDLLRARIAAEPREALRSDPDFELRPIQWAFVAGRLDMAELLIAAGDRNPSAEWNSGAAEPYTNATMWGHRDAALWLIERMQDWRHLRGGQDVVSATLYGLGPDVAQRLIDRAATQTPESFPLMVLGAFGPARQFRDNAFLLRLLADARWAGICRVPANCVRLARYLALREGVDEIEAFFGRGWTPPPQVVAEIVADQVCRLDVGRLRIVSSFPVDREALERILVVPSLPGPPRFHPPTDESRPPPPPQTVPPGHARPRDCSGNMTGSWVDTAEGRAQAGREQAQQRRQRTEVIAILRRLGIPAGQLASPQPGAPAASPVGPPP